VGKIKDIINSGSNSFGKPHIWKISLLESIAFGKRLCGTNSSGNRNRAAAS
jgi:hypothetical protein